MSNLLASDFTNGLFVFVLGLLIVFFGISIIVLVVSIIGKLMNVKKNTKSPKETVATNNEATQVIEEGLTGETVAAITAVLTAYYFSQGSNCEFKIKKIKRLY